MMVEYYDWVDYFPSFEIITGNYSGSMYYEENFREVNNIGIAHVMRSFLNNYTDAFENLKNKKNNFSTILTQNNSGIICDEAILEAARK